MTTQSVEKIKRKWCYIMPPRAYEVAACPTCGTPDTQWSEFEKHIWCDRCKVDFKPVHFGIFDGPIPLQSALMMGVSFDRIDLVTNERLILDPDSLEYRRVPL